MAFRHRRVSLALAFAALAVPAAAQAQVRTIDVPASKKWQHFETKLIVPQALAGLPRTAIIDTTNAELDIAVQFGDPKTTQLTLYLFRPTLRSVPVWFDRVETQIRGSDAFGNANPTSEPIAFAPSHAIAASALRRVYAPDKSPYKATGAAILPLGDWLVAIRLSSTELDPAELDAKLVEVSAGLGWPAPGTAEAIAAVPVQPCIDALAFSQKAKLKKPDMSMALFGALLPSLAEPKDDKDKPKDEKPAVFCREGAGERQLGTYRAIGGGSGYVIALADAGRTIDVYAGLPFDDKEPGYAVTLNELAMSYVFPSFDKLPAPARVLEMVAKTKPISSTTRGGKDINIIAN